MNRILMLSVCLFLSQVSYSQKDMLGLNINQARTYLPILYTGFEESFTTTSMDSNSDSICWFKSTTKNQEGIKDILLYIHNQRGVICVRKIMDGKVLYQTVRGFDIGGFKKVCSKEWDMSWERNGMIYKILISESGRSNSDGFSDMDFQFDEEVLTKINK